MKRLDRRKLMLLASVGTTGAVLTACGNDPDDVELNPTMIPDVEGAPPTLAPVATPGGGASAPEEDAVDGGGEVVTLEAQDPYAWSTKELEAAPGQVIQVTNAGFLEHNFHVDEWDVAVDLPPGEPVDVTVPEDAVVGDSFVYYCSVPGHREGGMEGTLTIVEAGAAAPAGESTEASPQASPGATPEEAPAEAVPAEGGGDPITLEAQDPFNWSVNQIEASPGQVIQATNVGFLEHNFTIDDLGIAEDLPPGEPVEITVPDDVAAGDTFEYYCSVPGHREGGMVGTLAIV